MNNDDPCCILASSIICIIFGGLCIGKWSYTNAKNYTKYGTIIDYEVKLYGFITNNITYDGSIIVDFSSIDANTIIDIYFDYFDQNKLLNDLNDNYPLNSEYSEVIYQDASIDHGMIIGGIILIISSLVCCCMLSKYCN